MELNAQLTFQLDEVTWDDEPMISIYSHALGQRPSDSVFSSPPTNDNRGNLQKLHTLKIISYLFVILRLPRISLEDDEMKQNETGSSSFPPRNVKKTNPFSWFSSSPPT